MHFGFGEQGEENPSPRDLEVADEHGTIMEFVHGLRDKHADEQLARHDGLDLDAGVRAEFEHVGVLFKGDDRARTMPSEFRCCSNDFFDDA